MGLRRLRITKMMEMYHNIKFFHLRIKHALKIYNVKIVKIVTFWTNLVRRIFSLCTATSNIRMSPQWWTKLKHSSLKKLKFVQIKEKVKKMSASFYHCNGKSKPIVSISVKVPNNIRLNLTYLSFFPKIEIKYIVPLTHGFCASITY